MYQKQINKIGSLVEKIKTNTNLQIISDFLDWFYQKLKLDISKNLPNLKLKKGEIYYINLGKNIGGELNKIRPCIIYSKKIYNNGNTIIIIPIKSYKGNINKQFNTFLKKNSLNNLHMDSITDLGAIKQISKKRLLNKIGNLDLFELKIIDSKIIKILGIKNRDFSLFFSVLYLL